MQTPFFIARARRIAGLICGIFANSRTCHQPAGDLVSRSRRGRMKAAGKASAAGNQMSRAWSTDPPGSETDYHLSWPGRERTVASLYQGRTPRQAGRPGLAGLSVPDWPAGSSTAPFSRRQKSFLLVC